LDIEQPGIRHPVEMERRKLHRDAGVQRGLLTADGLVPTTYVRVQPLPNRLSQQRHRHKILSGIHVIPPACTDSVALRRRTGSERKGITHSSELYRSRPGATVMSPSILIHWTAATALGNQNR